MTGIDKVLANFIKDFLLTTATKKSKYINYPFGQIKDQNVDRQCEYKEVKNQCDPGCG